MKASHSTSAESAGKTLRSVAAHAATAKILRMESAAAKATTAESTGTKSAATESTTVEAATTESTAAMKTAEASAENGSLRTQYGKQQRECE
jgi:hypothetical protein